MKNFKHFLMGLIATVGGVAVAATFNQFSPATGVLKGNASSYITTAATSSDIRAMWTGTCNLSTFLRGDGACSQVSLTTNVTGTLPVANGGTGAVTLTGLLQGNGTSPITGLTGTSGGIPYFNSTTTVASSGLLTANALVLGGGAGTTPATLGSLGTTTTVLHGNAAGAPTFGAVSLTADVSGILPFANGGTGLNAASDDTTLISSGSAWVATAVPNCTDTGGNHLNYTTSTNLFSCGTTAPGGITGLANPTGTIGLTAVNGSATTAIRSDGAPALSQSIVPTWTGAHTWSGAAINTAQGSDVASSGTINLDTATGNVVDVTGTTTITAVTLSQGRTRIVRFTGALTLTNGASLVLPGGANITTVAGDYAVFVGYASSVVRVAQYQRGSFQPIFTGTFTPTVAGDGTAGTGTYTSQNGFYTVIGNRVFFDLLVTWTATTGTGNTLIRGLPFTSSTTTNAFQLINCSTNASNASSITALNSNRIDPNTTQIVIIGYVAASGTLALPLQAAAQVFCSGNYKL